MIAGTIAIFSISGRFSPKVTDETVTRQVHAGHHLAADGGEWRKPLFPESACGKENPFTRFRAAISAASKWHYDHSFPWKKGEALVFADFLAEYERVANGEHKRATESAAGAFFQDYHRLKDLARASLNGTFKEADYPDVEQLRVKFAYTVRYQPVSEGGQFAQGIEAGLRRKLEAELEATNAQRMEAVVADAWRRLLNPMEEFAARITAPDFKPRTDSLKHVRSILGLLPALHQADPALSEAARRIGDTVNTVNAEELHSSFRRAETAAGLGEIVSRFGLRRRFSDAEAVAREKLLAAKTRVETNPEVKEQESDVRELALT